MFIYTRSYQSIQIMYIIKHELYTVPKKMFITAVTELIFIKHLLTF